MTLGATRRCKQQHLVPVEPDLYFSCVVVSRIEDLQAHNAVTRCELVDHPFMVRGTARNFSINQGPDISEYKQLRITTSDSQKQTDFLSFNLKLYTRVVLQHVCTHKHTLPTNSQAWSGGGPSVAVVVGFEGSLARQTQVLGLFL